MSTQALPAGHLPGQPPRPVHTGIGITGQAVTTRILSLDIFRGFTMAVMIFVNDIGEMGGLPAWSHHYPAHVDAMSYVDMVYPFFLFAVGLSLPLAVRQRLRRDPSIPRLSLHILSRVVALVALGLIIANVPFVYAPATHMRGSIWALLALVGGILFLNVYPQSLTSTARPLVLALRGLGLALVVLMFALFRRQLPDGRLAWIDFSYPEILGLIGLTYLGVCLLYIPTRRLRWAPLAWLAALLAFNSACCAHWITSPVNTATLYAFPFDNGAMASLIMAGIVVSGFFLPDPLQLSVLSAKTNLNPALSTGETALRNGGTRGTTPIHPDPSPVPLTEAERNGENRTVAHNGDLRPAGFYDSALAPGATHPTETEMLARLPSGLEAGAPPQAGSRPEASSPSRSITVGSTSPAAPTEPTGTLPPAARRAFTQALTFAVITALLGLALKPLGISKIRATPSWALWSIAAATLVFALFFYLLDIRRRTVWSAPLRAPGANTLLTYLLPDLFYYAMAALHLQKLFGPPFNYGLPGILRALVFTGAILGLSYLLTRAKLRLQL